MVRPSCREIILDAAEAVVMREGAARLTLDAAAKEAGVSKGGVLYHFPTKESLIQGMVDRLVARTQERRAEALKNLPAGPSQGLRAELASVLTKKDAELKVGAGMLAVVANEPQLLTNVVELVRARFDEHAGADQAGLRRAVLLLAADGLHFLELLQISPLTPRQRAALVKEMNVMADELSGP